MAKKVSASPKLFIGMDIHKRSWKIHFTTDITIGSSKTFTPNSEALLKYVNKYYPRHEIKIAYEAGCCGFSAARDFIEFGWDTFVVNPADIPRSAKMGFVKTDRTIRSLIVESSWVAIRIDPALQQYFRKHAGFNSKAAIFKVARKLLSRIYAVVKSETKYEVGLIG